MSVESTGHSVESTRTGVEPTRLAVESTGTRVDSTRERVETKGLCVDSNHARVESTGKRVDSTRDRVETNGLPVESNHPLVESTRGWVESTERWVGTNRNRGESELLRGSIFPGDFYTSAASGRMALRSGHFEMFCDFGLGSGGLGYRWCKLPELNKPKPASEGRRMPAPLPGRVGVMRPYRWLALP